MEPMKRHLLTRILALFLTLATGLCLPGPARALRPMGVEKTGLEEEIASELRTDQPAPSVSHSL